MWNQLSGLEGLLIYILHWFIPGSFFVRLCFSPVLNLKVFLFLFAPLILLWGLYFSITIPFVSFDFEKLIEKIDSVYPSCG
jgi:hypothetical protein